MFGRAGILLTTVAGMLATPVAAQTPAPTTTAFDGTYVGVSSTFEEDILGRRTWSSYCLPSYGPPRELTIVNGIARSKWGGPIEGSVNPQGLLIMRNANGARIEAQLAGHGTVTARWTGGCSYKLVWQKVPAPTMPFDGDYIGVSQEFINGGAGCSRSGGPDGTLIIRNGVAHGQWQGTVSPQGIVSLRTPRGTPVDGQIDRQGMMRAQGTSANGCTNLWVWHKQAG